MRRKTNKRPLLFEHEGDEFMSEKLGYLEAAELGIKYAPILITLHENFDNMDTPDKEDEDGEAEIDLKAMLKGIPSKVLTDVIGDLLSKTYLKDEEEEGKWELLDPQDFESFEEIYKVVIEVFKFNYPDLFKEGSVIGTLTVSSKTPPVQEPPVQETPLPENQNGEILQL